MLFLLKNNKIVRKPSFPNDFSFARLSRSAVFPAANIKTRESGSCPE
jgi:hypothetical protein